MAQPFDDKLVVTVSSRALFDLEHENRVFNKKGLVAYRRLQRQRENALLKTGPAFPLVRKLLSINARLPKPAVDVVLVSNNDADTAIRIFNSVEKYGLNIARAAFTDGAPKYPYLRAFKSKLYLSASMVDVREAIDNGFAAAHVIHRPNKNAAVDANDELRIGFDFDGILADDESESVYQKNGLRAFISHEKKLSRRAHSPGPIYDFLSAVGRLRKSADENGGKGQRSQIRTAIITARDAGVHRRFVTTLRRSGLPIDETFFLGGAEKAAFIHAFSPDIYFDDQVKHLQSATSVATAFVPYGVANHKQ